jgi:acyl CoA:acetate/3-ketoacid CoA transferase alpha subunit
MGALTPLHDAIAANVHDGQTVAIEGDAFHLGLRDASINE